LNAVTGAGEYLSQLGNRDVLQWAVLADDDHDLRTAGVRPAGSAVRR
jgi:hypothetical protein